MDASLPRIVAVLGIDDYGPSDGRGSTGCPHCGADGRYVWRFIVEDGSERGAMRGCFALFPKAAIANAMTRVFERIEEAQRAKRNPTSWDTAIAEAAGRFQRHEIDLAALGQIVSGQSDARKAWLNKRYGGKAWGHA